MMNGKIDNCITCWHSDISMGVKALESGVVPR